MSAKPVAKTDLKPGQLTSGGTVESTKLSPSRKTIVIVFSRPDGTTFTDRMSAAGSMMVFTDETAGV